MLLLHESHVAADLIYIWGSQGYTSKKFNSVIFSRFFFSYYVLRGFVFCRDTPLF